jgi:hypothetical protein
MWCQALSLTRRVAAKRVIDVGRAVALAPRGE